MLRLFKVSLFLVLVILAVQLMNAQIAIYVVTYNSLPATCTSSQIAYLNTGSIGLYLCEPSNTWVGPFGTGSGSGTITGVTAGTGLSGGGSSGTVSVNCHTSTASQIGCAEPDNSTIKATAGVYATQNTTVNGATCTPGGSCNGNWNAGSLSNSHLAIWDGIGGELQDGGAIPVVGHSVQFSLDGGGSVLTTGPIYHQAPYSLSGTVNQVSLGAQGAAGVSCSISLDVWKVNAATPTSTNKISGTTGPTVTSTTLAQSISTSGWSSTTVALGDVWMVNVASVSGCITADLVINWQ